MTHGPRIAVPLVVLAACGRTNGAPDASREASASVSEAGAVPRTPDAGASPREGAGAALSWIGSYKSEAGSVYVPDGWKVRWRAEDEKSGIGEGPITLSVDATDGRVQGEIGGPLGPATLEGQLAAGVLSASIVRRDPHDHGFVGVLRGVAKGDRIEGTLHASPSTAGAVRTGTFSLSPHSAASGH
jgi:hypothetical protein